jgi:hypothetical protein
MFRTLSFALLLSLVSASCNISTTTTTTISNGDLVSNINGMGTGDVAGVEIEVQNLSKHNSGVTHSVSISETPSGAEQAEKWDIQFGEVSVVMEREGNETIELTVDGQRYGSLKEGDKLLIDADRDVIVNDVRRNAE